MYSQEGERVAFNLTNGHFGIYIHTPSNLKETLKQLLFNVRLHCSLPTITQLACLQLNPNLAHFLIFPIFVPKKRELLYA